MRRDKYYKARRLVMENRVKFVGLIGSSLYFSVKSKEREHKVIFRIPTRKWLCDCEYFSIKAKDCSHIIACKLWLRRRKK